MGMGFGSDDLRDRLEATAGDADVDDDIPLDELFPGMFMHRYTEFESIDAFLEASPWTVTDGADVAMLPGDELDEFVREHSSFENWDEMLARAGEVWRARQLGY
jgi:hypothetical protein